MASDKCLEFLSLDSLSGLSTFLGLQPKELAFFAYGKHDLYYHFSIPKKNGNERRQIDSPKSKLKSIQRQLAVVFDEIYKPNSSVFGFISGRSIADNASVHTGKRFVVKIDLEDFFPTISSGRVRGLFKSTVFGFNDEVANTLTNLVCQKGSLPQGAPTSPVLSNMICWKMDREIQRYARSNALKYTRYADDLTFSSTKKSAARFLINISKNNEIIPNPNLQQIIENNGFRINAEKTGIFSQGTRQTVTGVVVNEKCNFKREDYRYMRLLFHYWKNNDEESAARYYISNKTREKYRQRLFTEDDRYIQGKLVAHIRGLLDYYSMIESASKRKSEPLQRLWTSFHDITESDVPEMLPERMIIRTDCIYGYRSTEEADFKDGGGVGTAFYVEGIGLTTAKHCVENVTISNPIYSDEYYLTLKQRTHKKEYSSRPPFKCGLFDDWATIELPAELESVPGFTVSPDFSIQRGETVVAFGFADGDHNSRRIEATVKEINENEVIVDRAFIKGMSGGPVLNSRGYIIGLIVEGSGNQTYDRDGKFLLLTSICSRETLRKLGSK